jgi:hypothetical protein
MPMPGLLQTGPQPQAGGLMPGRPAPPPVMPQPGPPPGMQQPGMQPPMPPPPRAMLAETGNRVIAKDRAMFDEIKQRARVVGIQAEQMGKLMMIAQKVGIDVSALEPIMETLQEERQRVMKQIIAKQGM